MSRLQELINRYKKNNIIRHSAELFFTQGFASAIALLNTSIMAYGLGIEGVGIVGAIVAYAAFFDGLLNFQSYNAVIKFGSEAQASKDTDKMLNYFCLAFFQDTLTAVVAFILGFCCIGFAADLLGWNPEIVRMAQFYLISIPMNINGSTNGVLRLNDKFTYTGTISIVTNALKTVLLLIAIRLGLTIQSYLCIEVLRIFLYNVTVFLVSNYVNIKKYGRSPYHSRIRFDKEFTKYNIYNNLVSTVDMPTGQLVSLIINRYLGFSAVGIYSILTKLGSIVAKVTSPVSQSMLPELSRLVAIGNESSAWKISKKMLKYINLIGVACVIIMCSTFKLWMPFFMEATWINNIYFGLYVLYLAFTAAAVGIHAYFIAKNYVKYNLYICIICNIMYLIVLFATIQQFGLLSVILSLLMQAVMVISCKLIIVKKKRVNSYKESV